MSGFNILKSVQNSLRNERNERKENDNGQETTLRREASSEVREQQLRDDKAIVERQVEDQSEEAVKLRKGKKEVKK